MAEDKRIDLAPLSIAELEKLARQIIEEVARKRAAGREWLQQHGQRIHHTDAPKYQNPNNAAQTWSGRGKQPGWVEEVLAQGGSLEGLLTDGARRSPRRPDAEGEG